MAWNENHPAIKVYTKFGGGEILTSPYHLARIPACTVCTCIFMSVDTFLIAIWYTNIFTVVYPIRDASRPSRVPILAKNSSRSPSLKMQSWWWLILRGEHCMPVLKHRIYREIQVYDISIRNTCDIIGLKTTMLEWFYFLPPITQKKSSLRRPWSKSRAVFGENSASTSLVRLLSVTK